MTPYEAVVNADGDVVASTTLAGSVTPATDAQGNDVYEFVPLDNFNGDVYLSYTVADGNGPGLKVHTVFDVAPVQDAPSLGKLSGDGLFLGEIQEDTTRVFTEAELLNFISMLMMIPFYCG